MIQNKYDYIIYGASVKGIVKAISQKNNGNSVLLLNKFGFSGGAITEALRLPISKKQIQKNNNSIEADIYTSIVNEKYSILGETESEYLLNPEVVKIVLLQFIEENNIDHLFHVVPSALSANEISLIAKEGIIKINYQHFSDESDESALSGIINSKRNTVQRFYNIIVTKPNNLLFLQYSKIMKSIELKDGRYFLSLIINEYDEAQANHKAQLIADELSGYLEKSGNRIQLLPTRIDDHIL